ncbi:hypothetical protein C6366_02670 [Desulfonatronum sp. SC1]|nr:hypothetical protein C6366_02670 [Desulfonatronum sp. SC1]
MDLETAPDRRVVDPLREDLGLLGTKEGCGGGECGTCAVLVDGVPRLSCLMLAAQLEGRVVVTVEGLGAEANPHPIQRALAEHGAVQCGYCTPGMAVVAAEREFSSLLAIQDNFPKMVLSLDRFDLSREGIIHKNLIDFLLDQDWSA